jgi:hypothetical protein
VSRRSFSEGGFESSPRSHPPPRGPRSHSPVRAWRVQRAAASVPPAVMREAGCKTVEHLALLPACLPGRQHAEIDVPFSAPPGRRRRSRIGEAVAPAGARPHHSRGRRRLAGSSPWPRLKIGASPSWRCGAAR